LCTFYLTHDKEVNTKVSYHHLQQDNKEELIKQLYNSIWLLFYYAEITNEEYSEYYYWPKKASKNRF